MEKVILQNYRCYSYLELSFKKKLTVLTGDNASGKTTILRALKSVLSSFFTGYSDENTRFLGLSKNDFTQLSSEDDSIINEKPIIIDFHLLGIEASLLLNSVKARQANRTGTKNLSMIKSYAKELQKTLFDSNGNQIKPLPLFASFSTEDIHSIRRLKTKDFTVYSKKPSFGYYECLQGEGLYPYWKKRLLVLKEGSKNELEITGVTQAIKDALGKNGCNIINDMTIRFNQGKLYYHLTDGREVESNNLTDGQARLVNIVTDVAFRCMLLNKGIYKEDACIKTKGTVLIDEIDLHLHPTLQSTVIKGLKNAFPELQFIVTTHSPMVMSSVKSNDDNAIYRLEYNDNQYNVLEKNLYGVDISKIIELTLNIPPRDKEVEEKLLNLFDLIDNNDIETAKSYLGELKSQFGDSLPELSKAQAMIDITLIEDEEDEED